MGLLLLALRLQATPPPVVDALAYVQYLRLCVKQPSFMLAHYHRL